MAAPDSESPDDSQPSSEKPRIVDAEDLFQGTREIWIAHGDEMYRLRITASGKLLLTK